MWLIRVCGCLLTYCGVYRTGSLGNSAVVHPVFLVNFIMQVGAIFLVLISCSSFSLSRFMQETEIFPVLSELGGCRGFFPSQFFPHRGFCVCVRGFFP